MPKSKKASRRSLPTNGLGLRGKQVTTSSGNTNTNNNNNRARGNKHRGRGTPYGRDGKRYNVASYSTPSMQPRYVTVESQEMGYDDDLLFTTPKFSALLSSDSEGSADDMQPEARYQRNRRQHQHQPQHHQQQQQQRNRSDHRSTASHSAPPATRGSWSRSNDSTHGGTMM
jgi:hypothetical protein